MLTLVVPVFRNEQSIPDLVQAVKGLSEQVGVDFEAVFVDDGSPDKSRAILEQMLPAAGFRSRLVLLSRNFGSFAAVRAGLAAGSGDYFAIMAADLQEPPELILEFHKVLAEGAYDVVVGSRDGRADPLGSRLASALFWRTYRFIVQREVPAGGVDVFACTRRFRDEIMRLSERNSTLVGLIFWLGFRRSEVHYARRARRYGASAWSFRRKFRYLLDSTFAFSDLPIRLLSLAGIIGMSAAVVLGLMVLVAKLYGDIPVPGYAATVLVVMFFGGLNSFGIGVLGEYLWRTFENTKDRPSYIAMNTLDFGGPK